MQKFLLGPNAARFLHEQMNAAGIGKDGTGRSRGVYEVEYADPFTVRWSQQQNENEGAWIVWIPEGALLVEGMPADISDFVPADGYPEGWYLIEDIEDDAEELYLLIDGDGVVKIAGEIEDNSVIAVAIAHVEEDPATGAIKVRQRVSTTLNLHAGRCFDIVDGVLINCFARVGGKTYELGNGDPVPTDGIFAVVVPAKGEGVSATYETYEDMDKLIEAERDDEKYVVPLYKFANGIPVVDFRGLAAVMGEF